MPWQLSDVDSHCAGLSDKRKQVWVAVANGALAECLKNGGTDKTCAPKAIRIANSRAKGANHKEVAKMANANLTEVGKTISAATAAKLKAAMDAMKSAMEEMRGMMPETDDMEAAREPEDVLAEAQKIITKGKSLDAIRTQVSAAIQDKFGKPSYPGPPYVSGTYTWCRDIFTDAAVYELDGKLYRVAYTIDATSGESKVLLGEPVEVEVAYVTAGETANPREAAVIPVSTSEIALIESATMDCSAFQSVDLVEAVRKSTVPIKLISPGWGSSGYYSERVLREDGPEAFPMGTHMYWNHPTETEAKERPEGDIDKLAAVLVTTPEWRENGPKGKGLYAESKLFSDYADQVGEKGPYIGVSIRAKGEYSMGEAEGRKGKIIERLVKGHPLKTGHTTDFVTRAGAGGVVLTESAGVRVAQLFESARERVEAAQGRDSTKGVSSAMDDTEKKALDTALAEAKADATKAQAERDTALAKLAEHDKATLKTQAAGIVAAVFAEAKVSPPEVLAAKLTATAPIKEGKLDADAFRAEVKAIAESMKPAATGGEIKGMGSGAETGAADDPAAHKALVESWERRFRNQGKKPDEAKQLAETAARGR